MFMGVMYNRVSEFYTTPTKNCGSFTGGENLSALLAVTATEYLGGPLMDPKYTVNWGPALDQSCQSCQFAKYSYFN